MRHLVTIRLAIATLAAGPVLALAAAAAPAESAKRPFGVEDFYRVLSPSGIDLSPAGDHVVYALRSTDLAKGASNTDLYRVPVSGGEPQRLTWTEDASESSPVFSPDGSTIAFVAKRGEQESEQIWLLPAGGGEARPLTAFHAGAASPLWSPDARHIAFTARVYPDCGADDACNRKRDERREEGPLEAHVADELLYRHWSTWADGKVTHLFVAEVSSGSVRDLTPGNTDAPVFHASGPREFAFSPDGSEVCFTRNGDAVAEQAWSTNSDLWVVPVSPRDGAPAEPRNVTEANLAWDGTPRYSPDGRYIAYRRQSQPGYESDLFQLALYERETGRIRVLTEGFDDWVEELEWLSDASAIVFAAPSRGQRPLFRLPVDGGEPSKLVEHGWLDAFELSPDGSRAYVVRRSVGEPPEIWSLDLNEGAARERLTRHNLALETEVDIRPAESIWVEGAEGRRIQVFLVKPHGFDPAGKYPLILNVRGGPQGMWADSFRGDWQVYPGAGYVVAFPNPTGSTGFGQDLTDAIAGDWGGRIFEDLMKVTDALEKLPWIDAERMGAMGWSYGGYMMNWFQGHTRRFKALASMMGSFDLPSLYYTTEELWFPEWDMRGTPWTSDRYERWNPAASVESFSTPMLIVTGELDYRIPYTQGLMSFTALRRRGVPARLVVLPEAGHWPGWYEMALYYTAHLDWFARYLGGAPPPWSVEAFAANAVFDPKTGKRVDR